MMRKKTLATGLVMAAMLVISACGSKNTAVETTVAGTTATETTMEETTSAAKTDTAGAEEGETGLMEAGGESETHGDLTDEQIKSFAEEIQAAVASQDLGWLADLAAYPVYVSLGDDEGSEILSREEFMAISKDQMFTETMMSQIAEVKPEELEMFGAGIIMGEEVNITFNNVDGEPAITGINL